MSPLWFYHSGRHALIYVDPSAPGKPAFATSLAALEKFWSVTGLGLATMLPRWGPPAR